MKISRVTHTHTQQESCLDSVRGHGSNNNVMVCLPLVGRVELTSKFTFFLSCGPVVIKDRLKCASIRAIYVVLREDYFQICGNKQFNNKLSFMLRP